MRRHCPERHTWSGEFSIKENRSVRGRVLKIAVVERGLSRWFAEQKSEMSTACNDNHKQGKRYKNLEVNSVGVKTHRWYVRASWGLRAARRFQDNGKSKPRGTTLQTFLVQKNKEPRNRRQASTEDLSDYNLLLRLGVKEPR